MTDNGTDSKDCLYSAELNHHRYNSCRNGRNDICMAIMVGLNKNFC